MFINIHRIKFSYWGITFQWWKKIDIQATVVLNSETTLIRSRILCWNSHCISNYVLVCSNRVPNASNYILAHSNVSFPPANVGPRLLPHGMSDERRLHKKEPEIILSHVHVRWLLERECCMYTERTMLWWNRMYLWSV